MEPNHPRTDIPSVLVLAGLDPTGGAGIQADIEAIASQGAHACPVVTALTVQDTDNVMAVQAVEGTTIAQQARAVLEDVPVAAVKIGMLGSTEIVEVVHSLLRDYPDLPVVLDPVLAAGGGYELADDELVDAIGSLLLPQTTVLTPNTPEIRRLAPEADSVQAAAMALLEQGVEYVLATGTHDNTDDVVNRLFGGNRLLEDYRWPRLEGRYHGSGCTLASAIAGLLSQGHEPLTAIQQAQTYAWATLKNGFRAGMGQLLPNRFYWAMAEEESS